MSDGCTLPISSSASTPFVASTTSTSRFELSIVSSMARRYPGSSSTTTTNCVPLPFSSAAGADVSRVLHEADEILPAARRLVLEDVHAAIPLRHLHADAGYVAAGAAST